MDEKIIMPFIIGIVFGVIIMWVFSLIIFKPKKEFELKAIKENIGEYYINKETNEKEFRFVRCEK